METSSISLKVPNPWTGASVFVKERTSSTMDDARALALGGCAQGTVVVAGYQERGRGRAPGREWHSRPWQSLLATVVLDARGFTFPVSQLPLRATLALCLAVEEWDARPEIKWPNDLLVEGRKLAGILCEMCGPSALVGLGVNCAQRHFPRELGRSACSLVQVVGREVNPVSLLSRVLARMKETFQDDRWMEKVLARLAFPGDRERVFELAT